jgi:KaiC/GvpD/RAD55 family RecA-like ATPase
MYDLIRGKFFYNANVPRVDDSRDRKWEAEAREFLDAIREVGEPVLVIIDTMARSLGSMDENAAAAANTYLELTERFRQGLDCTVLTVAHASNKKGKNNVEEPDFRGSSAFSAGFDAVWVAQINKLNRTVELFTKYLKESDSLPSVYFKLESVDVGAGNKRGAVLMAIPQSHFREGLDATPTKKDEGAGLFSTNLLIEALRGAGAYPGGANQWHENGGLEPSGGVTTAFVVAAILGLHEAQKTKDEPTFQTSANADALKEKLQRFAKTDEGQLYVMRPGKGARSTSWALRTKPKTGLDGLAGRVNSL